MLFTMALQHFLRQENVTEFLCYFVPAKKLMSSKTILTYYKNVPAKLNPMLNQVLTPLDRVVQ